ncbi:redoxin domain-containing protein [bacterium]|nr:redoxin domain-containing protein [bacterium]
MEQQAAVGMFNVGDAMPAWEMEASGGGTVSSAELVGKTYVLFMYPKAHTGG